MGTALARSCAASAADRAWAGVREKGRAAKKASKSCRTKGRAACPARRWRMRVRPRVRQKSSSNTSRRRAVARASQEGGKWMVR